LGFFGKRINVKTTPWPLLEIKEESWIVENCEWRDIWF
jgi:hypothetical protein